MSFYLNQNSINQAVLITQIIGRGALTLAQINSGLTAASASTVTETYLVQAARNGWLLLQPNGLWQVNRYMNIRNALNTLISSYIPNLTLTASKNQTPASYIGGIGTIFSQAVQQTTPTAPITYYGTIIKPGLPLVNDTFISVHDLY